MPVPFIPPAVNNWLISPQGQTIGRKFPLNLIAGNLLSEELQRKIFQYLQHNYLWPQVCERQSFEPLWDKLNKLAKINLEEIDLNFAQDTLAGKDTAEKGSVKVSDSCIYDAIDRLANINHFISFQNGNPMQYMVPQYMESPYQTSVYDPNGQKVKGGNAILDWNADNEDYYLKHYIACRHHYTYGLTFARSEFVMDVSVLPRQNNMGQLIMRPEITRIGTSFDPISIRRIWLNYRMPVHLMEHQPCPFYFEEMPYFATLQKVYDPDTNPFGFANLDKLAQQNRNYIYTSQETESVRRAIDDRLLTIRKMMGSTDGQGLMPQVLSPEYSVDALWTMYPMLPLDEETGDWLTYSTGQPVPMKRYIVQTFGSNLSTNQIFLRLQRNFYPRDGLPIYASSHMPNLDDGAYTPALGEILFNHYKEIVTCTNQFIANKDWINDPPCWINYSSPASDEDLTRKGAKIKVNGPSDFGWRQPYDATASTSSMRSMLREECQTTSKAVDAILGKAMGGRTSATEASNAYQASMSGITTDINLFNAGISGGFAQRVWDYAGLWLDPDLLAAISGQFGFILKPEDLWLSIGIKTNVGSDYITRLVLQQNLRYVAESTVNDPNANRVEILTQLFQVLGFTNPRAMVNDSGQGEQIAIATRQAQKTYLNEPVNISPDQNHQIAIAVKTAFIEDEDSAFNEQYPQAVPLLVEQIKIHQQFAMLQMQMQLAQQAHQGITGMPSGGPVDPSMMPPPNNRLGAPPLSPAGMAQSVGGQQP